MALGLLVILDHLKPLTVVNDGDDPSGGIPNLPHRHAESCSATIAERATAIRQYLRARRPPLFLEDHPANHQQPEV
jgi:hypothetical protein